MPLFIKIGKLKSVGIAMMLMFGSVVYAQSDTRAKLDSANRLYNQGAYDQSSQLYLDLIHNHSLPDSLEAEVYNLVAFSLIYGTNRDSAIWYAHHSLALSKKTKKPRAVFEANLTLGTCWYNKSRYDSSIYYYFKALDIANEHNIPHHSVLENVGLIYERQSNDSLAEVFYLSALDGFISEKDSVGMASIYINLAILSMHQGEIDESINFAGKSIAISEGLGDQFELAVAHLNLGVTYQTYDNEASLIEFKKSAQLFEKVGDLNGVAYSYLNLGVSQAYLGDQRKANFWFEKAQALAEQENFDETKLETLKHWSRADSLFGDYESAYRRYYEYANLERELAVREKVEEINLAQSQFDFALKEKENDLLQAENQVQKGKIIQKNTLLISSAMVLVILFVFAAYWYRQVQEKHRKNALLTEQNEKIETLMRELHHRVKNNLQVISSLLGLQSSRLDDPTAKKAVLEGKSRVRAMSLIHQRLYQKEGITEMNFQSYVSDLVADLKESYMPEGDVNIDLSVPDLSLDIEKILPLGLILNELISNSFKYAFEDIQQPLIKVEMLKEGDNFALNISDNGKGIQTDIKLDQAKSFGLKLVNLLVKQLNGSLTMENSHGLSYKISFQMPQAT
ncbi:MAG: histidine kinase dimerization/phosphoacceptor domain -containing protein [Cyclobacteriaceae bacterium]